MLRKKKKISFADEKHEVADNAKDLENSTCNGALQEYECGHPPQASHVARGCVGSGAHGGCRRQGNTESKKPNSKQKPRKRPNCPFSVSRGCGNARQYPIVCNYSIFYIGICTWPVIAGNDAGNASFGQCTTTAPISYQRST
jgi:hypothetical protein